MSIQRKLSTLVLAVFCALCASCAMLGNRGAQTPEPKEPERARISPKDQIHTAYHEAAHAVVDAVLHPGHDAETLVVFSKVSKHRLGYVHWTQSSGKTARWYRSEALVYYAGGAAEERLFKIAPPKDDPDSDNSAMLTLPLCDKVGCPCPPKFRVGDRCLLDGWLETQRPILYAAAMRCVEANLGPIIDLAHLVMLKPEDGDEYSRSLKKAELKAFFRTHPLKPCPEK